MLLQSLLRPVLTPLMRGMFDAPIASSVRLVPPVPLARWHQQRRACGSAPATLTSQWQDYAGTTPVATPGTVADSCESGGAGV
jgi:hypothetical protein